MLSLAQILKVRRMMEQTGGEIPRAMDRHDNPEHRVSYEGPALNSEYQPKPDERVIDLKLEYDSEGNIVKK